MFVSFESTPSVLWLYATAVFALAGMVKGVVGLGLPTVSMALLALQMPPATAAALLIVPSFVTNVWQMRPLGTLPALAWRLAPMQVGVCVGTLATAWVLGAPAGAWPGVLLGLTLIAYAVWGLAGARPGLDRRTQVWLGPLAGALTGAVASVTGVFVMPAIAYLQALGLSRDELIQAMGLSFTVSTVALAVALRLNDQYPGAVAMASLAQLLPAVLGMWVGQAIRAQLSPGVFRAGLLGALLLLGLHLVWRDGVRL